MIAALQQARDEDGPRWATPPAQRIRGGTRRQAPTGRQAAFCPAYEALALLTRDEPPRWTADAPALEASSPVHIATRIGIIPQASGAQP